MLLQALEMLVDVDPQLAPAVVHAPAEGVPGHPAGRNAVSWVSILAVMFTAKVLLLLVALPVAFVFFIINIGGSYLIFGGIPGLEQMVRNEQISVAQFSLVPIPLFVLMGEVLFHTGLALKSVDAVDAVIRRVPGRLAVVTLVAGTIFSAISGSTIATTAMLGSLLLPQMLSRGYDPKMAMGPDACDRRRRYPDSAIGPRRAAGQPRRNFDYRASGRRHRAGADPERAVHRLCHAALLDQSGACTVDARPGIKVAHPWINLLVTVAPLILIFGIVVVQHDRRLGDADRIRARSVRSATILLALCYGSLTPQKSLEVVSWYAVDFGLAPVHHRRRDHIRPASELLRRDRRARGSDRRRAA